MISLVDFGVKSLCRPLNASAARVSELMMGATMPRSSRSANSKVAMFKLRTARERLKNQDRSSCLKFPLKLLRESG